MEHRGTLAPGAAAPRRPLQRLDRAIIRQTAASPRWSAVLIGVVTVGALILAFDLTDSVALRLVVGAAAVGASVAQAGRLRDRDRLAARERKATKRSVEDEARLKTLLEHLPAAVYLDRYRRSDGSFLEGVYLSPQIEQLTGHAPEAFLADNDLWLTLLHPEDRERALAVDVPGHLSQVPIEQEYRIVRADGEVIWIREEARVIESDDPKTILSHGFFVDITDRKALEQQLGRLAFHDVLTGLANRAVFSERLTVAMARSARTGLYPAVLFLDLDEFKTVNDSLGHAAGDRLLQVVAERLRASVRPADCVARLGGDEFAVLLEDAGTADVAIASANWLLSVLRSPIEIDGRHVTGRGSIGIALAGSSTMLPNDLLRDADAAMYRAKAGGRGNWVLFEPEMHTEALAREHARASR